MPESAESQSSPQASESTLQQLGRVQLEPIVWPDRDLVSELAPHEQPADIGSLDCCGSCASCGEDISA